MTLLTDPKLVWLINAIAIAIMSGCLFLATRLRTRISGGLIKKKVDYLFWLILFFTAAYLVPPFLAWLPEDLRPLLVALFSIAGAIYVTISVKLVDDIIRTLTE